MPAVVLAGKREPSRLIKEAHVAESSEAVQKSICSDAAQLIQRVLNAPKPDRSDAWEELHTRCVMPIARMVAKRLGWGRQFSDCVMVEKLTSTKLRSLGEKHAGGDEDDQPLEGEHQHNFPSRRAPIGRSCAEFYDGYQLQVYKHLSQYDPGTGAFSAWCYRVLYNWAIDLCRAEGARRRNEVFEKDLLDDMAGEADQVGLEEIVVDRSTPPVWQTVADKEPLSPRQIANLGKMPPLRRVLACAAAALVWRIPAVTWRQWVQEAGLEPSFPPPALANYDKPLDRLRFLAKHLGMPYLSIRQHWYRSLDVLRELFRELLGKDES